MVRVDGQKSVYLPILKQGGNSNTIRIVNGVRDRVKHLLDIPKSLVANVVFDQSRASGRGYYTEADMHALHERLVKALAPGGYLIVGTSERVADPRALGLTSPFHFIYRKS